MNQAGVSTESPASNRVVCFGAFELFLDTRELRKHGVRVRLQDKPFRILCALLERSGHVVTREELRAKLWSSDTFVDFESGLNTAVNRLRSALGDSAENPVYVETLARIGYRFIGSVANSPALFNGSGPSREAARKMEAIVEASPEAQAGESTAGPVGVRWLWMTAGLLAGLLVGLATFWLVSRPGSVRTSQPTFHQLTFDKEFVSAARFAHGGQDVVYNVYGSGQHGHAGRIFLLNNASAERRQFGAEDARLAAVSSHDDAAIFAPAGSKLLLEDIPLHGGAARVLSEGARNADWAPDGTLCLVTERHSLYTIEYPPGHPVYTSRGWISDLRVSPKGDQIAFSEHPIDMDDAGQVVVVSTAGRARILSSGWGSLDGLAWRPSGNEIWFTAARSGVERALMAVDLSGKTRQVALNPGGMRLLDIAPSGNALIARTSQAMTMILGRLNQQAVQDISWLDWSRAVAISSDGKRVLFDETGSGAGKNYRVYVRDPDRHSPQLLGPGRAVALSADGRWALTQPASDDTRLSLVSIDRPETIPLLGGCCSYRWAMFFPNGKEILFQGRDSNGSTGIYRQQLPNGHPILIKNGVDLESVVIDRAGRIAAGRGEDSAIAVLDLQSGAVRSLDARRRVSPVAFTNEQHLLVSSMSDGSIVLESLDLQTGDLTSHARIQVPSTIGVTHALPIHFAGDMQTFVYSQFESDSDLFLEAGWK